MAAGGGLRLSCSPRDKINGCTRCRVAVSCSLNIPPRERRRRLLALFRLEVCAAALDDAHRDGRAISEDTSTRKPQGHQCTHAAVRRLWRQHSMLMQTRRLI